MTNECVICGRPTPDGFACATEAAQAAQKLAAIVDLAPEARNVAYGLQRGSQGGASGKPGSRSPGNDDALDALHAVANALTTIARDIAETRGIRFVSEPFNVQGVLDPLVAACSWLQGQMEWVRHATDEQGGPYAPAVFAEIADCARRIRLTVEGPAPKRYLGPCGAERQHIESCAGGAVWCYEPCTCWCHQGEPEVCEGDVYVRGDARTGRCDTCKAEVDRAERQAWLDGEVRQRAYRASEIEDAYGISANLIRQWATEQRGLLRVHDRDFLGRARYMLGEVLDLATAQKLKAAERAAQRERRAAARAAEVGA